MFKSVRYSARSTGVRVVGRFEGEPLDKQTKALDEDGAIAAAAKREEGKGSAGSIAEAYPKSGRVLLVGLGPRASFSPCSLRDVAANVGRRLARTGESAVSLALDGPIAQAKADPVECGVALGEGFGLIGWCCDSYRGTASSDQKRKGLSIGSPDKHLGKGMKKGLGLADSTNIARTLSQTPPNVATPSWMAAEAKAMCSKVGMGCRIIKGAALERERLNGLINVGKASENEPCLIRMEWKPSKPTKKKPIVLLGKTITYDSGGLSLKINNSMKGMKRDKDGGCTVFGAMHAIATVIKPKRPVIGLLVAAENSVSDEAYRPDDVFEFRNGVTVEITNTDAEGRLVLADGLCWACDKEKPDCIVDLATLTGGVVIALGQGFAGMWCDDDDLRQRLEGAGQEAGERLWRLPHDQFYRDMMKSPIADIVNSAPVREAHPIQGAAFLSYFVDEKVPWAHIDIAGVHATDKETGPYIAGPKGFGVRMLARFVEGK